MKKLIRGVTSNNYVDFFCRNCMHSYRTENRLKNYERLCINHHDHCETVMPKPNKNIVEFKSNEKSLHILHVIYAHLEAITKKIQSSEPNPEKSYTEKKNVYIACSYALHVIITQDENLITSYRGTDCMQKFGKPLKTVARMIINTPQKPMIQLTDEEKKHHEESNTCHICNDEFCNNKEDERYHNYRKVRDHCHYAEKYRGAVHSICNLKYKAPKEIPVIFHNGSKYDYHFIINELAKGIDDIICSGGDTEKYITFTVPLKKENKNGNPATCKLKFMHRLRFMNSSLSTLVDNLSQINKQECNKCKERKNEPINCTHVGYENNRLTYKCDKSKNISYKPTTSSIERFPSTYQFCKGDNDKCAFSLRKGINPFDYTDDWETFKETQLPLIKDFYNALNQTDISKEDYGHAHKVCNTFDIKNLREYHDLYVQSDTLLLADAFESFRKIYQEKYQLDPAHFVSAPGLTWQAYLKKEGKT